jgi:hypothetical protein
MHAIHPCYRPFTQQTYRGSGTDKDLRAGKSKTWNGLLENGIPQKTTNHAITQPPPRKIAAGNAVRVVAHRRHADTF